MADMVPTPTQLIPTPSFTIEIQTLLTAFGDSERPLQETAEVVECWTQKQLQLILNKAVEVANRRGNVNYISMEDVIFLMRKNPLKVQRLLTYMKARVSATSRMLATDEYHQSSIALQNCKDFLKKLDTNGQLWSACNEELYDPNNEERQRQLNSFSRSCEGKKYLDFVKARQASFLGVNFRHEQKFQDWLLNDLPDGQEIRIDRQALEILSYLSVETVGRIVSLSMKVKKELENKFDPLERSVRDNFSYKKSYPNVQVDHPSDYRKSALKSIHDNDDSRLKLHSLSAEHVREAFRRLQQNPRSPFGWGGRLDSWNQRSEADMPILAL